MTEEGALGEKTWSVVIEHGEWGNSGSVDDQILKVVEMCRDEYGLSEARKKNRQMVEHEFIFETKSKAIKLLNRIQNEIGGLKIKKEV